MSAPVLDEKLAAYARLSEYAAGKRYHLLENEINTDGPIGVLVQEIDQKISQSHGLSIFTEDSPKRILEYEDKLGKDLHTFTNTELISSPDMKDEREAINKTYNFKEYGIFKEYTLLVEQRWKKYFSNKLTIKDYQIIQCLQNASDTPLQRIDFSNSGGSTNAFFLLMTLQGSLFPGKISLICCRWTRQIKERLTVKWIIPFTSDRASQMYDEPIQLFFYFLERYGEPFRIYSEVRKFVLSLPVRPNNSFSVDEHGVVTSRQAIPLNLSKDHIVGHGFLSKGNVADKFDLLYFVNCSKYWRDFKKGLI